jgi:beta-glucuronidase
VRRLGADDVVDFLWGGMMVKQRILLSSKFWNLFAICFLFPHSVFVVLAQDAFQNPQPAAGSPVESAASTPEVAAVSAGAISAKEIVHLSWEASSKGNFDRVEQLLREFRQYYGEELERQKTQLTDFPARGSEDEYAVYNDFATVLFVWAEMHMNYGKTEKAIELFKSIIDEFPWSTAWDPRGWRWKVAEKSQDSIDVMAGKPVPEPEPVPSEFQSLPKLHKPGVEKIIDYKKYGEFVDVGTGQYKYQINDQPGLMEAVGEGIYPNTGSVLKNPGYKKAKEEGRLEGTHWDFVRSDDLEAAFYKWATARESEGVKLFYIGLIFEKAGMLYEAIKAYHAIVVHFPHAIGWTYWETPWYPAQAAISKIKHIVRTHPELNLKVKWMKIEVAKGFDNKVNNDIIVTYPGIIEEKTWWDRTRGSLNLEAPFLKLGKPKKIIGGGRTQLIQFENNHWQLRVDGKPFVIKGVTYAPTKIGQSPDKGTLVSWMYEDDNKNGKPDGPYDAWVDKNQNNTQDSDEPVVGDFQLMKEMGVNTIREYHQPFKPNKELLRKMHEEYGFYVIMGDFLGKYTLGSGADWSKGTDYQNEEHKKNMMESVRSMVMEYKDEPFILMWLIGNENNYGVASNADKKPEAYFEFVNEVAKMIKSIDPNHLVAICNGDTLYLDIFAEYGRDVDIYSANVYRGDYGFGAYWEQVMDAAGKPAFVTEYGCPAYARHLTKEQAEKAQAEYHQGNWLDIEANFAGRKDGTGNALGGVAFEWTDEWWKNYEPFYHDRKSDAIGPFPGGFYYEEWFGPLP